jgi:molecular chaperone GrpE
MYDHNQKSDTSAQDTAHDAQNPSQENQSEVWKDKYMHLLADFQNFQKRLEKEYGALKKSVQVALLLDIFSILDNVQRALQSENDHHNTTTLRAGIELVRKDIMKTIEKYHVRLIDTNTDFNPVYHEAISYVDGDGIAAGKIVTVFEQGYMFDDGFVIRPAKVSVAR